MNERNKVDILVFFPLTDCRLLGMMKEHCNNVNPQAKMPRTTQATKKKRKKKKISVSNFHPRDSPMRMR